METKTHYTLNFWCKKCSGIEVGIVFKHEYTQGISFVRHIKCGTCICITIETIDLKR